MNIIRWKIWYGDGSTWSSDDGPWDDAPVQDVQVVMLYHDVKDYRTIVAGEDVYSLPALGSTLKYGKWMKPDDAYQNLVDMALAEGS